MLNFKKFATGTALLEASQRAEDWLKNYTLENLDKYPSSNTFNELVEEYPYTGGTIYRGLNFADKEQFDKFMENTKDGTVLETGSISSWAPDAGTTYPFAVTRPTYFIDRELMQAEDEKNRNIDYMIGHAGLILKTTVKPNVGLDVRKTKHSKESEIILPPGSYSISIHKKLLPFMHSIDKSNFKKEFLSISSITNVSGENKIDPRKFEHIMFHYTEFDAEMKEHLFKLIGDKVDNIKFAVDIREDQDWDSGLINNRLAKMKYIYIGFNLPTELIAYFRMLLSKDQAVVKKKLNNIVKQMDNMFDEKTSNIDWAKEKIRFNISQPVKLAIKMGLIQPKFYEKIKKATGTRYNALNSYERMKEINSLTGKEKEAAIRQFTKDIEAALNNLA